MTLPPHQPMSSESDDDTAVQESVRRRAMPATIAARDRLVNTWEECEAAILEIEKEHRTAPEVLFRGQSNSDWPLYTTLERPDGKTSSIEEYLDVIRRVKPEIETFTGSEWDVPNAQDVERWTRDRESLEWRLPYAYMAHLRHHGFPSPLLDWTASPYVAAYFAFAHAQQSRHVAIYVFVEIAEKIKLTVAGRPYITIVDPYMTTNKRHFLQRSRYTICIGYDDQTGWQFVPHQKVFDVGETHQDLLWKLVIPVKEREKVLRRLDRFNLNAYSLFGSDESLMETLAMREIDLKPKNKNG